MNLRMAPDMSPRSPQPAKPGSARTHAGRHDRFDIPTSGGSAAGRAVPNRETQPQEAKSMKKHLLTLVAVSAFGLLLNPSLLGQTAANSEIQGKWTLKKNSDRWGEVTQTVEFKDATFTYRIQSKQGDTMLFAKGKVKLEKLGSFKVMKLTDIVGGYSEDNLESTNDDRDIIYLTGWNTLTVAMNFDRDRMDEKAEVDTYTKAKN